MLFSKARMFSHYKMLKKAFKNQETGILKNKIGIID